MAPDEIDALAKMTADLLERAHAVDRSVIRLKAREDERKQHGSDRRRTEPAPTRPSLTRRSEGRPKAKIKPTTVMFPDGTTIDLGKWKEVLSETARYLADKGLLKAEVGTLRRGSKPRGVVLVTSDPGVWEGQKEEGQQVPGHPYLWVKGVFSSENAVVYARELLDVFGEDPKGLIIDERPTRTR